MLYEQISTTSGLEVKWLQSVLSSHCDCGRCFDCSSEAEVSTLLFFLRNALSLTIVEDCGDGAQQVPAPLVHSEMCSFCRRFCDAQEAVGKK